MQHYALCTYVLSCPRYTGGQPLGNGTLPDEQQQVGIVLQEATEILTAASKGCGSYAKPILRHITAVADAVKKDGVQVSSTAPVGYDFADVQCTLTASILPGWLF